MAKISNLKVEKRESNTSLKLKQKGSKNQNMKENLPTTPNVSSLSQRDEGLKEVNTNIRMTPKVPTVSNQVKQSTCTCINGMYDMI